MSKSTPLSDALDKNQDATAEVKKAADELAVVHAVLDTKVADGATDAEVALAVARTKDVEKKLDASAEVLEEVNHTLKREVGRLGSE